MSLRDLVAGSDMCTPSDGAGPSNAMGSLVNTLLGGAAKTQEQLRELPMAPGAGPSTSYAHGPPTPAALALAGGGGFQIPGLAGPAGMGPSSAAAESFLQGIHHQQAAEWDAIFQQQQAPGRAGPPMSMPHPAAMMPPGAAPPALAGHFQAFMHSARAHSQFAAGPLPPELAAQLSVSDKVRIRNRSTILARHVYADMGDKYADQQVNQLLASLRIDPRELPAELPHVHDAAWHEAWGAAAGARPGGPPPMLAAELAQAAHAQWDDIWGTRGAGPAGPMARTPSTGWASEFAAQQAAMMLQQPVSVPASWAQEFSSTAASAGPSGWATEFSEQEQQQRAAAADATQQQQDGGRAAGADARASTAAMVDVLTRDADPKMRNSKFLQFVSKMSKGELIFEDNKVVERTPDAAAWADEFSQQQHRPGPLAPAGAWADEFNQQQQQQHRAGPSGPAGEWADEFAKGVANLRLDEGLTPEAMAALEDAWREQETQGWAQEFNDGSEDTYAEWERLYGHGAVETSFGNIQPIGVNAPRGEYVFSEHNPFLGDPEALTKGKDLFRRGVLTEAALALEAEVRQHPDNAEAWRLLGTVHAENDDDRQAIAAMCRAHAADPRDRAVLLALGVSHTNELDQWEAVGHLRSWLAAHPDYAGVEHAAGEAPDSSQRLSHAVRMFEAAAAQSPADPELHMALGVLHHLGRQYNAAVGAFERALQLRPQDYSLWNKLGATLANNARSAEALAAYQKALDLKPNYMRAWTNMGISYANLGDYERSARFYVRALGLNAGAGHVWGYLRTSLACAARSDLMAAVDTHDLGALQAALPLE